MKPTTNAYLSFTVLNTICSTYNLYSWRWAYRCPKHVEIFMIINHNCCLKLVPLVIYIFISKQSFFFKIPDTPYFPAHKTHFPPLPPEKCDLNSTCVLCAEGKYYFQTYKYPYIYYTTSLSWDSENNHEDDFSGSDDDFLGFYDE